MLSLTGPRTAGQNTSEDTRFETKVSNTDRTRGVSMGDWLDDLEVPEWLEEDPEYLLGGPDDWEIEQWEAEQQWLNR